MVTRFSILPVYSSVDDQFYKRDYMQGIAWPLIAQDKRLVPMQVIKTNNLGETITYIKLHSIQRGTVTDITSTAQSNGFGILSFTTYDIIKYFPQGNMSITTPEGQYYVEFKVGSTTYFTEVFSIQHTLSDFIKLSYWHDEPFLIPEGHISYVEPYYNFVYLQNREGKSAINKPLYPSQDVVNERDGYEFPHHFVSKKRYRFTVFLPEFMIDSLRIVRHHHFKQIDFDGKTYYPSYFTFTPGDWVEIGNLCACTFEFELAEDIIQTTGKVKPESEGKSYDQTMYDESYL